MLTAARRANNVLIGEDHLLNEIPPIVAALSRGTRFDNFFCEVDPFTVQYLANKIKKLPGSKLKQYTRDFRDGFSFYAKKPEYDLFYDLTKSGVNMIGTEQVSVFSDRLILSEMTGITSNKKAKAIYRDMAAASKKYTDSFATALNKTFYIFTDLYGERLKELETLSLSSFEKEIIAQLKLSRAIYIKQDHALRVNLMKKQLLDHYKELATEKNLFKYGANHTCRGESFLRIYDIGNLISNISDSRFERSLHIMIVGKSGMQGSGIPGMPASQLDAENGSMKFLKPFFDVVKGSEYYCFDLTPIRRQVEKGDITVTEKSLLRTIMGYDFLVVIPEVSAAMHF